MQSGSYSRLSQRREGGCHASGASGREGVAIAEVGDIGGLLAKHLQWQWHIPLPCWVRAVQPASTTSSWRSVFLQREGTGSQQKQGDQGTHPPGPRHPPSSEQLQAILAIKVKSGLHRLQSDRRDTHRPMTRVSTRTAMSPGEHAPMAIWVQSGGGRLQMSRHAACLVD